MEGSKSVFTEFCQETSLHGWNFLARRKTFSFHSAFWFLTIISSLGLGTVLITWNTQEFLEATVDFNTLSMTTSMEKVFFPAIYVINKNLIRKSATYAFSPSDDSKDKIDQAFEEYVQINNQTYPLTMKPSFFHNHSVQYKSQKELDLDLQQLHKGYSLNNLWLEIGSHTDLKSMLLHYEFEKGKGILHTGGTLADNWLSPKNRFVPFYKEPEDVQKLRTYKRKAISGKDSGIKFWFDAEVYDYTPNPFGIGIADYYDSKGLTVGISHPFDFDLSEFHGIHVEPGTVVDIQVSTKLIVTPDSNYVRSRFTPQTRKCYFDDEIQLGHFPAGLYRYSMTNCLVEAQIQKIEELCNCTPPHAPYKSSKFDACDGVSFTCFWHDGIDYKYVELGQVTSFKQNGKTNECFANCNDQPYELTFSTTSLDLAPEGLKYCWIVVKLMASCKTFKYVSLDEEYPGICDMVSMFKNLTCDPTLNNFEPYKVIIHMYCKNRVT